MTSVNVSCFFSNKAKLCHEHLVKCTNFKNQVIESERREILTRSIPEDNKKIKKKKIDTKNINIIEDTKYLIVLNYTFFLSSFNFLISNRNINILFCDINF